jgi:hypothetical protein
MNFPFRLLNSLIRFRDSLAESFARFGRSIFNSAIFSRFAGTVILLNDRSTKKPLIIVTSVKARPNCFWFGVT